jgi:hypothetical protein
MEYSQIMASLLHAYRNIKISTQGTRDALAFHLHHGLIQYKPSRVQRKPLHFFSQKSANVNSILPQPLFVSIPLHGSPQEKLNTNHTPWPPLKHS